MSGVSRESKEITRGASGASRVASLYEKDFRGRVRDRVDCRAVRSDLGSPGIRRASGQPDEQHHDLVDHWPDHGADRDRDRGIQLAAHHLSATVKSTVCQPVAPSGTAPTRSAVWTAPVLSVARTVMLCFPGLFACQGKLHNRHVSLE